MLRSSERIPAVFATLGWCSESETGTAISYESIDMNTKMTTLGAALLAISCFCSSQALAQTTTTVTTTNGAFTEFVPGSETMVVRTESGSSPLRYSVTKQTTIVDEAGAPVAIDRISPGSPLSIQYTGSGDRLVASRVVVRRAATGTTAVTTLPAETGQQTNTTTTTTRPLTHEEKHALKEEREHQKEAAKEEIERQKEALEKAKDKLDDDD
jgi:hypothetical protein